MVGFLVSLSVSSRIHRSRIGVIFVGPLRLATLRASTSPQGGGERFCSAKCLCEEPAAIWRTVHAAGERLIRISPAVRKIAACAAAGVRLDLGRIDSAGD